jgi:hypothetical protein
LDNVPCFGFDFETDAPFGIFVERVHVELRVPEGKMPIDSAVIAVNEIGGLGIQCGQTEEEQATNAQKIDGFHGCGDFWIIHSVFLS